MSITWPRSCYNTMFGLVSLWHENGRDLPPEEFLR